MIERGEREPFSREPFLPNITENCIENQGRFGVLPWKVSQAEYAWLRWWLLEGNALITPVSGNPYCGLLKDAEPGSTYMTTSIVPLALGAASILYFL